LRRVNRLPPGRPLADCRPPAVLHATSMRVSVARWGDCWVLVRPGTCLRSQA
jgi:hypothetical protein